MALAFYPVAGPEVQITGVGVAGVNGFPLDRAAVVMPELQKPELDDQGDPTGERIPLTGDDLLIAAQGWAKRSGLVVADHEGTEPAESDPPITGMGDSTPQPPDLPAWPDPTTVEPFGPAEEA